MRSDGSMWMLWDSGILSTTGVDALKDVKVRMEVVDDGSKSGGVALGWQGTHGDLSHEFTATIGNRVTRFEEFVSYAANSNNTLAVAAQG